MSDKRFLIEDWSGWKSPSYDFTYDINTTRDGPMISVSEGWRNDRDKFATRIYDTRENAFCDKLIELGWTPPGALRDIYLSGYDSGFYSDGSYFPEQAWQRYKERK